MFAISLLSAALAAPLPESARLSCVDNPGGALADHPVALLVDTEGWIDAGELDADCETLRVTDLDGVDRAFWVEGATCDTGATRIWVSLPEVPTEPTSLVLQRGGAPASPGGDGVAVFPLLFDDFETFDRRVWEERGSGDAVAEQGALTAEDPKLVFTADAPLSAGDTALVARIDAVGGYFDDFEIGGGEVDAAADASDLWAGSRSWYGFTHLSFDDAYYNTAPGTSPGPRCTGDLHSGPWLPTASDPRRYTRVEVTYEHDGTSRLVTDAGVVLDRAADAGCEPASPLPVLVVFDHLDEGANPTQRLDFVLVRPTASPEPVATIIEEEDADGDGVPAWVEGCGDSDGDGIADHADPLELPTTGTTTTSTSTSTSTTTTTTTTTTPPSTTATSTTIPGTTTTTTPTTGPSSTAPDEVTEPDEPPPERGGSAEASSQAGSTAGCGCGVGPRAPLLGGLLLGIIGLRRARAGRQAG
jgi:hypothetical protein